MEYYEYELQMLFMPRNAACHLEVVCIYSHACDHEATPFCVTVVGAMLAQLLPRRVSSKQIAVTANALWCCTLTSKCYDLTPATDIVPRACHTIRDLHTFAHVRVQPAMGVLIRTEISPLMRTCTSPFAGKSLSQSKLFVLTTTRYIWGQGAQQKGLINQGSWRWIGNTRMKLPKQDTVRGFSTSHTFGSRLSQLPVWGLIVVNFAVYVLWQTEEIHWMIRNWMVSVESVLSGRLHTMLTYSISNNRLDNLIEDMLGLYFFGGEIARIYGGSYMLMVYLMGAIAGSLGHIAYCGFLVPWLEGADYDDFNYSMTPYALGASAPTNALVVIHVLLFPHHIILANYVLPVPGIVFGAFLVLADVYDMYEEGARTTHAGGVAGALSGVYLWRRIKRGKRRPLHEPPKKKKKK